MSQDAAAKEDTVMTVSSPASRLDRERWMAASYADAQERPTAAQIARLAYHVYETRGRQDGQDLDDWLAAEQQLKHHYR